jgi:hypothetical protein
MGEGSMEILFEDIIPTSFAMGLVSGVGNHDYKSNPDAQVKYSTIAD